ncbi:MAG: hypothetical protein HKM04_09950 [Legionellales bacterium]|nr:hypothetical protein [Legionellales bacterium]
MPGDNPLVPNVPVQNEGEGGAPPPVKNEGAVPPPANNLGGAPEPKQDVSADFTKKTKEIVDGFPSSVKSDLRATGFPFDKLDTLSTEDATKAFDNAIAAKQSKLNTLASTPAYLENNGKGPGLNGLGVQERGKLESAKSQLQAQKSKLNDHLDKNPQKSSSAKNDVPYDQQMKSYKDKDDALRDDIERREKRVADLEQRTSQMVDKILSYIPSMEIAYLLLFYLCWARPSKGLRDLLKKQLNLTEEQMQEIDNLRKELQALKKPEKPDDQIDSTNKTDKDETTLKSAGDDNKNTPAVELNRDTNTDTPAVQLNRDTNQPGVALQRAQEIANNIDPNLPPEEQVIQFRNALPENDAREALNDVNDVNDVLEIRPQPQPQAQAQAQPERPPVRHPPIDNLLVGGVPAVQRQIALEQQRLAEEVRRQQEPDQVNANRPNPNPMNR